MAAVAGRQTADPGAGQPGAEILAEGRAGRPPDAIVATGRSDYPNQVNNVLCFPFIFRGALDVGATTINEEMKVACVEAIAVLARVEALDPAARGEIFSRLAERFRAAAPMPAAWRDEGLDNEAFVQRVVGALFDPNLGNQE